MEHVVRQGECLSAIAKRYGFASYRIIYDHPDNAELRRARPNPNLLFPGDVIVIPDRNCNGDMIRDDWRSRPRTYVLSGKEEAAALAAFLSELIQLHAMGWLAQFGDEPGRPSTTAKVEYAIGIPDRLRGKNGKPPDAEAMRQALALEREKPNHVHLATVGEYSRDSLEAAHAWLAAKGLVPSTFARRLDYFEKAAKEKDRYRAHLTTQARKFFEALLAERKVDGRRERSLLAGRKVRCHVCPKGTSFEDALRMPSKEVALPSTAAEISVGDDAASLPDQSFWVVSVDLEAFREKHATGSWAYLPRTAGEPIGMEWWHFQLENGGLLRKDPQRLAAAEAALAAAEAALTAAKATRAAAGRRAPQETINLLQAEVAQAQAERDLATHLGWAELVYQIGWTRAGLEAIGYHDTDFTKPAR